MVMRATRLWSQQPSCHSRTNSTTSVPLADIFYGTAVTAWQTNFKVNHIYSYGSNIFSAECQKALEEVPGAI